MPARKSRPSSRWRLWFGVGWSAAWTQGTAVPKQVAEDLHRVGPVAGFAACGLHLPLLSTVSGGRKITTVTFPFKQSMPAERPVDIPAVLVTGPRGGTNGTQPATTPQPPPPPRSSPRRLSPPKTGPGPHATPPSAGPATAPGPDTTEPPAAASAKRPIHQRSVVLFVTAVRRVQISVAGQLRKAGLWEAARFLEGTSNMEQLARQVEET